MASATLFEYRSFCLQTGLAPSQLPSRTELPSSNCNRPRRSVQDTFAARLVKKLRGLQPALAAAGSTSALDQLFLLF
eukprot:4019946-Amphidinium_carterae.2